jgi:hypothetical protein
LTRILLISGDLVRSGPSLRRRVLRFTGSRTATRRIVERIEASREIGQVMSCLVLPKSAGEPAFDAPTAAAEGGWDVQVSYATGGGSDA